MKWFSILGLSLMLLMATSLARAQNAVRLSIATGGTGGIYYPIGSGMAGLLSKYVSNVHATAEVTSASVDNCLLLNKSKVDLALAVADTAWDAYQGKGKGFGEKVPLRTLVAVYPIFVHLVTLDNRGIEKVTDLKGKAVSTGAPEGWTEFTATRILESVRLSADKDVTRSRLGVSESNAALKEKKIDAYFWGGGIPTASVTDLAVTPGMKMKLIPLGDDVSIMREKYGPAYVKGSIPARTYPGQDLDIPVALVWNLLLCHENMKEDLAYRIVKTIFEHQPELAAIQREARFLTPETQAGGGSPIPYHPGALRYFGERGIKVR
jgi:TRAP transporter TAXI family solute receptor